jgi:hypothetical protein
MIIRSSRFCTTAIQLFFLITVVLRTAALAQGQVASPEKFFGFRLGSDRKIARWDRIVDYYRLLEREGGGKLKVVEMGPSTMGNPFLLVVVSAPGNLARLDRLREVNARISDPRGLTKPEVDKFVAEGRAVICQSMSLHATEIGGTQMAPELAYDLVTRQDEETRRILDSVIFLMVPSFNPDGQIMVTDWYQKTLGTEYEGGNLPWLYHKYVGHDNNRDAFQTNMVESQYMARILFTDWVPQAYLDHHHMGSYGARIYVPPYAEPVRPFADPLSWREQSWYGAHIAYKEEEAGLSGVLNMAQYSGWGHFGFHWITPFHNIAGMLTESASARLASPIFIHPDQLRGDARGLPSYEEQTTFPDPWPGGWWRLRDIVERQRVSAWALLDLAARNRETVLRNAYMKAKRQTERGEQGTPAAYVIPAAQHDSLTAALLVNKLQVQGIEIHHATTGLTAADGMTYAAGSWVVLLAQPKMGLIRHLLGRTFYPDNSYTRDRDGSPIRPYDMATDTMYEFMGVRVDPVDRLPKGDLRKMTGPVPLNGSVASGASAWSFDGRLNQSHKAANLLLDKGVTLRRADKAGEGLQPGDFLVPSATAAVLSDVARQTGVNFIALKGDGKQGTHELKRLRIGMYQRYWGGNIDEGWTRFLLEQFSFPYATLMDAEIKKGELNGRYDVIILPDDSTAMITGERSPSPGRAGRGGGQGRFEEAYPPEYRSGIGNEGVTALKSFVEKGGVLVTLGAATDFAIEKLGVPVRSVLANKPAREFFCPGSTLRVRFDNTMPLAYGMPTEGLVVFLYSQAFEPVPTSHNERTEVAGRYVERDLLRSGWLVGEENLARKAAILSVRLEKGKVVLIGFRTQHRAQTYGTFKLLFNALVE